MFLKIMLLLLTLLLLLLLLFIKKLLRVILRDRAAVGANTVGSPRSSPLSGGAEDAWRRGGEDAVLARERLGVQGRGQDDGRGVGEPDMRL